MSFSGWKEVILNDVVDILGDGLHGTPKYDDNGEYYFINGNNLNGKINIDGKTKKVSYDEYLKYKKDLNDRTILVSINGTLGNVALYNNEKVMLGKSACYFNVVSDVNKHFVKYVMLSNYFKQYIQNYSTGTTIKNIGLKQMREFSFALPELKEQNAIIKVLSSLDNKIEINNQINKTLESMAQEIFKHWFVDFEFPNENGEPYKSSGGEMVESELRMIPKGWKAIRLNELVESVSVKHKFQNEKVIFLNTSDILDGEVLHNDFSLVSGLPGQAKKSIQKHDILYSEIRPKNKRFAFIDFEADEFVVSTKLMVLRSKGIDPSIPFFLLTGESTINELQRVAESRSGTFPQITFDALKYIGIAVPECIETLEGIGIFKTTLSKISQLKLENKKLTEIRDTLLPKLISGEIRVAIKEDTEIS